MDTSCIGILLDANELLALLALVDARNTAGLALPVPDERGMRAAMERLEAMGMLRRLGDGVILDSAAKRLFEGIGEREWVLRFSLPDGAVHLVATGGFAVLIERLPSDMFRIIPMPALDAALALLEERAGEWAMRCEALHGMGAPTPSVDVEPGALSANWVRTQFPQLEFRSPFAI